MVKHRSIYEKIRPHTEPARMNRTPEESLCFKMMQFSSNGASIFSQMILVLLLYEVFKYSVRT